MADRTRHRVQAIGLAIASIAFALAALEVLLRVFGLHPALQSGWMLDSPFITLDDDVIIVPRALLAPSFYVQPDGRPLVLAIGDSFTQGFPVDAQHAYPAVLERVLARHGVEARVVNAGMGDSGPDQQLRLLEAKLLPRLRPTVVVWSLYANDLWDQVTKALYTIDGDALRPIPAWTNWIYLRQRFYDLLPLPRGLKQRSYLLNLVLKAAERLPRTRVPSEFDRDPTEWGLRKLDLELAALARLEREYGFVAYIVPIAPQSVYLAASATPDADAWTRYWGTLDHRRIAGLLRDRADVIDAWFGASHADDIFADAASDPAERGERHFNEAGYAMLAELVGDRLIRDVVFARDEPNAGRKP
jgi:lysophospholipase L1-like esterase